ncbi:MAG: hypothetical protein IPP99_12350 [Chitinophagaceae bacterium]|nr:hypothetical protein [Chitinophagaceae bacterium]
MLKPFSANRALVEYTLFTEQLLASDAYDEGLKIISGSLLVRKTILLLK